MTAEVVGGQTELLPEIHRIYPVNYVACPEKQNVIIGLFFEKGSIFIVVVSAVRNPGKEENTGNRQKNDTDYGYESVCISLHNSPPSPLFFASS